MLERGWFLQWQAAEEFYRKAQTLEGKIRASELFSRNQHKVLLECLAAGEFATVLARTKPALRVKHGGIQENPDFFILDGSEEIAFELTEVDAPGRQRGKEYQIAEQTSSSDPEEFDTLEEVLFAKRQIPIAIKRKIEKAKNYKQKRSLLLLVNLWFLEDQVSVRELQNLTFEGCQHFSAIWLLWGNHLFQTWPNLFSINRRNPEK